MVPFWSQVKPAAKSAGSLVALAGTLAGLGLTGVSAVLPRIDDVYLDPRMRR
jgi:hypothetical protein